MTTFIDEPDQAAEPIGHARELLAQPGIAYRVFKHDDETQRTSNPRPVFSIVPLRDPDELMGHVRVKLHTSQLDL